jgi:peptide/nickel transport system substrate-binding protein
VRFHNGDPVTADDVKFSFERYRGVSAKILKERVREVQVVDPHRVRFQLKAPWPDFLLRGVMAEDVRRTAGLALKPVRFYGTQWLLFTEQWNPKSPWADRRVRLAVNHAIDRQSINQSLTLGFSRMTGSIIPTDFEFAWPVAPYPYDPRRAKQLLAEAGYPQGFETDFWTDTGFLEQAEAVANSLAPVGIRARIRSLERAAYFTQLREKKFRPLVYVASAAYGNAATRIDAFVAAGGLYAYGAYPDIEGLVQEQADQRDRKRREATLHRIQQLMHERAMFAPVFDIAAMHGVGPRVAEPGFGLIGSYLWSGPYEDVRLKRP